MKYVICQNQLTGHLLPCVFGEDGVHLHIAAALKLKNKNIAVLSAGFVDLVKAPQEDSGFKWVVRDEGSESLGVGPDPSDELILNLFLGRGLTGLDLTNMLTYIALQTPKRSGKSG